MQSLDDSEASSTIGQDWRLQLLRSWRMILNIEYLIRSKIVAYIEYLRNYWSKVLASYLTNQDELAHILEGIH